MRDYGTAVETHLASQSGIVVRSLVWIEARNRNTGGVETAGFWNGLDEQTFTIGGESRTYAGAGTLLNVSPITGGIGLNVRMQQLGLSGVTPEVSQLIHLYDVRLAPIEVHQVHYDPVKGVPIGDPVRVLKGWVDEMPVPTPAEGGTENITLTVASAARALTRTLTAKKSDEAQRRISATDKGRLYAAVSGAVGVFWNVKQKNATPPGTTAPAPTEVQSDPFGLDSGR